MFLRARILAALSPWIAVLAMSIQAAADPYAPGPPWEPDSSLHTYCFGNDYTGPDAQNAADNKMSNLVQQTSMSKDKQDCNADTDAKFRISELGILFDGKAECLERTGNVCFTSIIELDRSNQQSDDDWAQTACHEIGHTVGLVHFSENRDDCMEDRHDEPRFRRYDDHHVDHINRGF